MPSLIILQDVAELIEGVEKLSGRLGIDPSLLKYVWWAVVALLLLQLTTWLKQLLWEEYVKPLRATPDEKRRLARRQIFASYIEGRIRDINSKEEWRDNRFTELEAEVEAEGERQAISLIPFINRTRSGLRKEKSLSRAIEHSRERLIQLEGEPGSGKSVALRFVARTMAARAARSRSLGRPIPLYLNLKELNRGADTAVDRNLIERFVHESLTRQTDRDIEQYLEEEFKRGMEDGSWLFLFDSFDELPEVLSSTESDATIRSYTDAISDFLGGMNRCRGVVASRHFRGPGQSRWPRFRILPLTEERRLRLVKQALLEPGVEQKIRAHLEDVSTDTRGMFGNPMLLGLICEHMKGGNEFPENVYTVLASYLEHRLGRDSERVQRRFGVSPHDVRAAAEAVAFCMTADARLGLSPTRESLKLAVAHQNVRAADNIDMILDALVFIKLARTEGANSAETFTFSHRRFQEYFATCVVLREPWRVSPRALLTDARWRETAVVMYQSQPSELLSPLAEEARRIVDEMVSALRPNYGEVRGAAARAEFEALLAASAAEEEGHEERAEQGETTDEPTPPREHFIWPASTLHVMSLLQEGLRRRPTDMPADIRADIGDTLHVVETKATLYGRKCALEVAGVAPEHVLVGLLRNAFASDSQLLKDIAYRQAANLFQVPDDIAAAIRRAVFNLAVSGRLRRERFATSAHLARLEKPERFISALNLLLILPVVDLFLHAAAAIPLLALDSWRNGALLPRSGWILASIALLLGSHLCLSAIFKSRVRTSRERLWLLLLYLRASFLFIVVRVVSRSGVGSFPGTLYLLFATYVMTWPLPALFAARRGRYTSWGWWPVMHLTLLLISLRDAVEKLRGVSVSELLKDLLSELKGLPTMLMPKRLLASLMDLAYSAASLVLFALYMPVLVFSLFFGRLRDWLWWRRRQRVYLEPMTGLEFVNELPSYRYGDYLLRYMRTVRLRGQLSAERETDEILEKLSLAIEQGRQQHTSEATNPEGDLLLEILRTPFPILRRRHTPELQNLADFDEWLTLVLDGSSLTGRSRSADILDELVLLLEQVRANRRDWQAVMATRASPQQNTLAPHGG